MFTLVSQSPALEVIARRASQGDAQALADLYGLYAGMVHRTAYRLTGSAADAEDVLQDVFVGLPEALRGYAGRGSLEGWVRRVAVRTSLMWLRRSGRRREVALDGVDPAAAAGEPGLAAALRTALAALPEPLRTVFVLKEVEGYSHAEIAAALDIRAGTSEVRLFRARKQLQALLRSHL